MIWIRLVAMTAAVAAAPLLAQPGSGHKSQPQAQHEHSQHRNQEPTTMPQTPSSLRTEHQHLHEVLSRAAGEPGALGEAARALHELLEPHFQREEEIATPPLGLLVPLSEGEPTAGMRAVLPMTEALERELPRMLEEHRAIRAAVVAFRSAAERAGRQDYVAFSDALAAHARQEEEILYPAAILVGRYVARSTETR
jgi:hypothetical protein